MNRLLYFYVLLFFTACQTNPESKERITSNHQAYARYGEEISDQGALLPAAFLVEMDGKTQVNTKIKGTITECCQAKGCWMKVDLENGEEMMVKFKDYGFFVPITSAGKTVVMEGNAFVDTVSVEDQRHYAMDAGESAEAIAAITQPRYALGFEASGVLIEE